MASLPNSSLLEFECHLDLQAALVLIMFAAKVWRIKIQTEQNKPHRKWTRIAQEFTVPFTIIIYVVTVVYIGKEFECMTCNLNLSTGSVCS